MSTIILALIDIIVVIIMITTFIKAFSNYKKVGKIDNYKSEISEEMEAYNKKGTGYMMIAVLSVPIFLILTFFIIIQVVLF
ncbi:hypothetical protein ACED96_02655 [Clostridium thermobutyricum]|uniref:Uncharacterized protein n=2 Tax=Clostridium thermobutyricum TaxID=29372 RepID=N9WFE4_9CLOT|nr:hypothetical protein [Clostridium thermobutyricum]ENZ01605.1 hypothetical protein HMPREF1092_00839 [Clostridium thermobutyricum]OPX48280.1 hypothetical protein CLTHE_12730 [Clostridium thermobutyricum DSM 4928]